jgi:hypothetical protein
MSNENLKLRIENISLNDRGRYQCQAENVAGRSEQIFDIQVYSK